MNVTAKSDVGQCLLNDTMAETTYPELEAEIGRGTVALWALGVIEEHGPHLPLGTDVYLPTATLREVRRQLIQAGQPAVIVPPFYWGVNSVTAGFTGSITVRPEVVTELVVDVLASLGRDGLERVFCLSGHGDALHNQTLVQAIIKARQQCGTRACFVVDEHLCQRLQLDPASPHVLVYPQEQPPGQYPDIHAGYAETSMIGGHYPHLLKEEIASRLEPTPLSGREIYQWTLGWSDACRMTPQGYLGDPASADPDAGRRLIQTQAESVTEAIVRALQPERPRK